MASLTNLNPQVKRLIEETGTNGTLTQDDITALSKISVKQLIKLFEEISKGASKRDALEKLRQSAVLDLRKQRLAEAQAKKDKGEEDRIRKEMELEAQKQQEEEERKKLLEKQKVEQESLKKKKLEEAKLAEQKRLQEEQEQREKLVQDINNAVAARDLVKIQQAVENARKSPLAHYDMIQDAIKHAKAEVASLMEMDRIKRLLQSAIHARDAAMLNLAIMEAEKLDNANELEDLLIEAKHTAQDVEQLDKKASLVHALKEAMNSKTLSQLSSTIQYVEANAPDNDSELSNLIQQAKRQEGALKFAEKLRMQMDKADLNALQTVIAEAKLSKFVDDDLAMLIKAAQAKELELVQVDQLKASLTKATTDGLSLDDVQKLIHACANFANDHPSLRNLLDSAKEKHQHGANLIANLQAVLKENDLNALRAVLEKIDHAGLQSAELMRLKAVCNSKFDDEAKILSQLKSSLAANNLDQITSALNYANISPLTSADLLALKTSASGKLLDGEDLMSKMKDALKSGDIMHIQTAMAAIQNCGLASVELKSLAKDAMDKLAMEKQAIANLKAALASKNFEALKEALVFAESCGPISAPLKALMSEAIALLDQEKTATSNLQMAINAGDLSKIEASLAALKNLGADLILMKDGRMMLDDAKKLCLEMKANLDKSNIQGIKAGIQNIEESGLFSIELNALKEQGIQKLAIEKTQLEALKSALASADIQQIITALKVAEACNLQSTDLDKLLQAARAAIALEQELAAKLKTAISNGDKQGIQAAMQAVTSSGLTSNLLKQLMEEASQQIGQAAQIVDMIHSVLNAPVIDLQQLKSTLRVASSSGLKSKEATDLIEVANKKLADGERVAEMLRNAIALSSIPKLNAALNEADNCNMTSVELRSLKEDAKQKIDLDLQTQQHLQALLQSGNVGKMNSYLKSLDTAKLSDDSKSLVEQVKKQIALEQSLVADLKANTVAGDIPNLVQLIDAAQESGLKSIELKLRVEEAKEAIEQAERFETDLRNAMDSNDLVKVKSCVKAIEASPLRSNDLQQLLNHAKALIEQEHDAAENLKSAIETGNVDNIKAALDAALESPLKSYELVSLIDAASFKIQQEASLANALKEALAKKDVKLIASLLKDVDSSGISSSTLTEFIAQGTKMLTKEQELIAALEAALHGSRAELQMAISNAEEMGLQSSELQKILAAAELRLSTERNIMEKVPMALESRDVEAIESILSMAASCAVLSDDIQDMLEAATICQQEEVMKHDEVLRVKRVKEEQEGAVVKALELAMLATDYDTLQAAVMGAADFCEANEMIGKMVNKANQKARELEVVQQLKAMLSSFNLQAIEEAMANALAEFPKSALIREYVDKCKNRIAQLQDEKGKVKEYMERLKTAMQIEKIEPLRAIIKEVEDSKLQDQLLMEALNDAIALEAELMLQKDEIDRVRALLLAAITSKDNQKLLHAIKEATECDYETDEILKLIAKAKAMVGDNSAAKKEAPKKKKEPLKQVPDHQIDIASLSNKKWLKPRFEVIKYDPKARFFSTKKRIWEIDFFGNILVNMSRKGKVKKSHTPDKLLQVEKNLVDNKKMKLQFLDANHAYELVFPDNYNREKMFEALSAVRPALYSWCPDICKPSEGKSKTEMSGSLNIKSSSGTVTQVSGACKVNVTSKPMETIEVYCSTWNMSTNPPPKDPRVLRKYIPPGKYDIYAIGCQESGFAKNQDQFFAYIQSILGKEYVTLASLTLWDIQLIVLARKKHFMKITNVQGEMKATGLLNICGNKGGVGIALRFNETNLLFINSHLAANRGDQTDANFDKCAIRNKNVVELIDCLKLRNKELDIMSQFHHIFWMGDLNYRLDGVSFDTTVDLVKKKNVKELLKHDQLIQQRTKRIVFTDWNEAEIKFLPSYKFVVGSNEFDFKKKRNPSYCDRILWKSLPGTTIQCTDYNSCDAVRTSDHNPVYAVFKLNTIRPYVSLFCKEEPDVTIVFDEVNIVNRTGIDALNKPLLKFYCEVINQAEVTPVGGKSAAPKFAGKMLPRLKMSTSHKEFLKQQSIIIALRDGMGKADTLDGLIGTAVLSLKAATMECISNKIVHKFSLPMYKSGSVCGTMEGSLHYEFDQ